LALAGVAETAMEMAFLASSRTTIQIAEKMAFLHTDTNKVTVDDYQWHCD
jgi:hypothetical protein